MTGITADEAFVYAQSVPLPGEIDNLLSGALSGLRGFGKAGRAVNASNEFIEGSVSAGARTEAANLAEQLTLKEAQAGAGERIMQGNIKDTRFPADTWSKMQYVHTTPDDQSIVIHYWQRVTDGFRTGFKFKD